MADGSSTALPLDGSSRSKLMAAARSAIKSTSVPRAVHRKVSSRGQNRPAGCIGAKFTFSYMATAV